MQTNKHKKDKFTEKHKISKCVEKTPQTNRNNKNANKHTNRNNKTHTNRNDKTKTNIKTQKTKNKHFLAFPTNHQSVFMSLVLLYIGNAKKKCFSTSVLASYYNWCKTKLPRMCLKDFNDSKTAKLPLFHLQKNNRNRFKFCLFCHRKMSYSLFC